ncbi:MAG: metalloregulator ArsR/SmtB family transcription factor [Emergencia sp.]|nr:metalloregulator ArsR/SmtB family transcription factor [Emergencia sp.]
MTSKYPHFVNIDIEFAYSATLELVSSLHVISDPSHHPNCISWYNHVIEKIDRTLLADIIAFGSSFVNYSYVMDIVDNLLSLQNPKDSPVDDFECITGQIVQMPDSQFVYMFLGETLLGTHELSQRILTDDDIFSSYEVSELKKYIKMKDARNVIRNPHAVKTQLLSIMDRYHQQFFRQHWEATAGFYKTALMNEYQAFKNTSVSNYVLSLHDDLYLEDGKLIMKKETVFSFEPEEVRHIKILFSTYTYPHLMMNMYGNTLSLYENLLIPNMSTVFDNLADSVRLFGDSTRLAILKLLLVSAANTKTLAKLLNMTPASVSQHLKILREAKILSSHREKNSVIYEVNKNEVATVVKNIIKFLEL